eukprot:Seg1889.5 transcript_id=Seg1889.5/GoldUCD/mRNA.D3Y31 product="hypothetical protein" protein_id=Seg1889.5/GoldUCD/D3Y31
MEEKMVTDEPKKYIEQFLQKKEANGKWIEYWVICRGNFLLFYSHRCETSELRDSFRGFIELTPGTRCLIGKRKKYSFPFFLATSKARYYFKSPTLLLRHQWIHAIDLALRGQNPESPSIILPKPDAEEKEDIIEDGLSSPGVTSSDSTQELILESVENNNEDTENHMPLPNNVIMVTSNTTNDDQVTNFLSGDQSPNMSNYRVTNFLDSSRDNHIKNAHKTGIDNLSFEEEDHVQSTAAAIRRIYVGEDSTNRINSPTASLSPKFSHLSPMFSRQEPGNRLPIRESRSAGSTRGLSSGLMASSPAGSSAYLTVKPTSSNLTASSNRFSRHLISSAPELKTWASNNT